MSSNPTFSNYMPPLMAPRAQKWNFISLLFSLFYFLPAVMSMNSMVITDWVTILVGYAIFLGLYFWGLKSDTSNAIYPILAILLCCFVLTAFTPGSNALFGFAMFLAAYYFPFKKGVWLLVFAIVIEVLGFVYLRNYDTMFLGIAIFLSIALFINAAFVRKDLQHRLSEARDQEQIQQLATIAERERISRDLHDLLGHSLSSIALKAELAEKLIHAGQQDNAMKEISDVAQLSRSALSEVRESVSGLKKTGISAELNVMCERLRSAGFTAECENNLPVEHSLSPEIETTLILLLKEGSTNILRHSEGNRAHLTLDYQHSKIILNIWDNGNASHILEGNGISGMKDRCAQVGAEYQIQHGAEGTLISICKEFADQEA
ncbi:sensor histidine kinase [Pseudoteredinibacter isoporae]|uniref:sensor histidine kinase n=1 Tax=Pseudoteredinibacter isoporae TaxID=570281 RepID=UPI003106FB5F